MRPFQTIVRIIIVTSVGNCAPVRPVILVAGRSPIVPNIPIPALFNIPIPAWFNNPIPAGPDLIHMGPIPNIVIQPPPAESAAPTPLPAEPAGLPPPPAEPAGLTVNPDGGIEEVPRNPPAPNSPKMTILKAAAIVLGVFVLAAIITTPQLVLKIEKEHSASSTHSNSTSSTHSNSTSSTPQ